MNFPSLGGSAGAAWAGLSGDVNNEGSQLGQPFHGGPSNSFNSFMGGNQSLAPRAFLAPMTGGMSLAFTPQTNQFLSNSFKNMVGSSAAHGLDPQASLNFGGGGHVGQWNAIPRDLLWGLGETYGGAGGPLTQLGTNMYSAMGKWNQNQANREQAGATATKNADVAAGGVNGLSGSVLGAATSNDVSNQLAGMAAQQMQAQQMYEGMIMQQLSMFSTLGGQGASMAMMGA